MALLKDLFSTSAAPKVGRESREAQEVQEDALDGTRGPETMPVKMNLEERMAFRRELLYEIIRFSLNSCFIPVNTYRFKVMRTDKRGHCFVVMLDMSPTFLASLAGQHASLKETANVLIKNAETKYGLQVGGVYWRSDDSLDVNGANWIRPPVSVAPAPATENGHQSNLKKYDAVMSEEMIAFEAAWQKDSAIQIGKCSYLAEWVPLPEEPHPK